MGAKLSCVIHMCAANVIECNLYTCVFNPATDICFFGTLQFFFLFKLTFFPVSCRKKKTGPCHLAQALWRMDVYETTPAIGLLCVHKQSPLHPQQIHIGHEHTLEFTSKTKRRSRRLWVEWKRNTRFETRLGSLSHAPLHLKHQRR